MSASRAAVPVRFYLAAAGVGTAFASINVSIPLRLAALHRAPALTGGLLAAGTLAIAAGALLAGPASARLGGGRRMLAAALGVASLGEVVFAVGRPVAAIACSALLVGVGIGMFWVASQNILGGRSGDAGSESGFIAHFAAYTFGAVAGSALTGATVGIGERAGLEPAHAIRLSGLVGAFAAAAALVQWLPRAERSAEAAVGPRALATPALHLTVQLADLFLVGALALMLPLTPLVLADGYSLGPFAVGCVMAAVSVAKIAGTFTAGLLTRSGGHRRSIVLLLGLGGMLCLLLCGAFDATVYVATLLAATLAVAGAWPVVVDAAQARVEPERRLGLTVLWNAREYAVVAAGTALAGWCYGWFGTPVPLFAAAAVLVAAGAVCSAVVLRRPVWRPAASLAAAA
jgi:MFS family permease